jgi:hypothetical protein
VDGVYDWNIVAQEKKKEGKEVNIFNNQGTQEFK